MTRLEEGFLLLTSCLGEPKRKPLTTAQFRTLAQRVAGSERTEELRELEERDLLRLGFGQEMAQRILTLLSEEDLLHRYLGRAEVNDCRVLTRISREYPQILRTRLGLDVPGCLWYRGDPELLQRDAVSLVGSRELRQENRMFAMEAGVQAAHQGYVLVSGNARGADSIAQNSCLNAGGSVICVVANELEQQEPSDDILYLSEDGFDLPFTAARALSRNRVIHCLGKCTLVAQCTYEKGGTWDGTVKNLRNRWSGVFCFQDGSEAVSALCNMGAGEIPLAKLHNLAALRNDEIGLFDQ